MPDPEFQCSTCEATFDTTAALLEHRRTPNSSETGIGGAPHRDRADSSHQATRTPRSDTGVINHYDEHDQYGFIVTSEVSEDVFFHVSDYLGNEPAEGDHVEFTLVPNDSGFKAVRVAHREPPEDPPMSTASRRDRWGQ